MAIQNGIFDIDGEPVPEDDLLEIAWAVSRELSSQGIIQMGEDQESLAASIPFALAIIKSAKVILEGPSERFNHGFQQDPDARSLLF